MTDNGDVNFFVVSGNTAMIVAVLIARTVFSGQKNILIREKILHDREKKSPLFFPRVWCVADVLCGLYDWEEDHVVSVVYRRRRFSNHWYDLIQRWTPFCLKNRKEAQRQMRKIVSKYDYQSKNFVVSDNSKVWRFVRRSKDTLYMFEHGLGLYIKMIYFFNIKPSFFKCLIKRISTFLTGYDVLGVERNRADVKFICTGREGFLKDINLKSDQIIIVDAKRCFSDIGRGFWDSYEKAYSEEFKEMSSLSEKAKHVKVCQCVLMHRRKDETYWEELQQKILRDFDSGLFILKVHQGDTRDYLQYSVCINNFEFYTIKNEMNAFIPVELILWFLGDHVRVSGSLSTGLLYEKWWLNRFFGDEKDCDTKMFYQMLDEAKGNHPSLRNINLSKMSR